MKRSLALGLSAFLSASTLSVNCFGQFGGTGQTGIGGAGATGGTGLGSTLGGTGAGGATTGGNRQAAQIGGFGGPGVTGAPLVDYSRVRVGSVFSGSNSGAAAATGGVGGATGASTASPFGANAFGGVTTGGGLGGLGGGLGGLGGGLGGLGGGLGGLGGGLGGLGGLNNRNRNQGANNNSRNQKQVRALVQPDIEISETRMSEVLSLYDTRLRNFPFPPKLKGVKLSASEGVVRLTGVVEKAADKKLAERMLMLEPGVDSVVNEIVVESK